MTATNDDDVVLVVGFGVFVGLCGHGVLIMRFDKAWDYNNF